MLYRMLYRMLNRPGYLLSLCLIIAPLLSCSSGSGGEKPTSLPSIVVNWTQGPSNEQTMKVEFPAVYDSRHKRIITFGGRNGNWDQVNETWAYDPTTDTWSNLQPPSRPPYRSSHAMVYDTERGKVLLFGGDDFSQAFDDLWEYDYGLNTWVELSPAHPPAARQMHGMVYDEEHAIVIMFGGRRTGGGAFFDDTWEYNPRSNSWRSLGPEQSPPIQDHINLVYDGENKKSILFSGPTDHDLSTIGTWAYDYAANTWLKLATEQSPSGDHSSLVYNRNSGTVMYFGNSDSREGLEVWLFDYQSSAWARATSPTSPPYREHFGMAYDSDSDLYLLTGGFPANDNWILRIGETVPEP